MSRSGAAQHAGSSGDFYAERLTSPVTSTDEITEALTYTKLLPGSTAVQVVAYVGWRLGGWPGSAVATAAFLLPSAIVMLALSYGYTGEPGPPSMSTRSQVAGLKVGVNARCDRQLSFRLTV